MTASDGQRHRNLLDRLLDRFARLVLGHRVLFILGVILVTGAAGYAVTGIRIDFTVQELFARADPEIEYLKRFNRQFGPGDDLVLLLVESDDVFRPDVLRYIRELTSETKKLPAFRRVESLTTVSDLGNTEEGAIDTRPIFETIPRDKELMASLRRRAVSSPLLAGRIVARDGKVSVIALSLKLGLRRAKELESAMGALEEVLANSPPARTRTHLLGIPIVRAEAVRLVKNDQTRFLPLGMVLTSLLLILLYRSFYEVAVPMLSVGLSAGYTIGLMSLFEVPIDILSNVLPLLVMVYGVADAVHVLGRVHEQMRRGEARDLAIRTAVRHLGLACLLTSATTSIGFASLLTGSMNILRRFGLFAAVGVMVAYVVTLVIAPLGVSLRPQRTLGKSYVAALPWLDRLLSAIASFTIARRRPLLVFAALLVGGTIFMGSRVEVNNYLLGIYHDDNPTAIATRLAERKLEGVVRLQVSLEGKPGSLKDPAVLGAMQKLQDWLQRRPEVTSTLSLATYVRELHRVIVGSAAFPETREGVASLLLMAEGEERINRFVDYPYSKARILIGMRDVGARRYLPLVKEVQKRLPPLFSKLGIETRVTGTSLVAYRGIDRLVYDLLKSLSVAFVIIGVLLAIVFRSVKIGLLSLIPNVLPLTTGLGYMAIVGMRLEPATVIIFSIAFGIAVDDTIHFFSRYREEVRNGATPEDAVRSTLRTAGRAMVFTSLVLITGFSVTLTSNFPGSAHFGELGGVILATALVTDLLVTPACLLVFRPWGKVSAGRS